MILTRRSFAALSGATLAAPAAFAQGAPPPPEGPVPAPSRPRS